MVHVRQICWQLASRSIFSCSQAVSKPVWRIPLLCVQWKTPDDGQRNCPKHVEFHSKNKFEKLVHLVGFILRNLSRCTVTWTSNSYHNDSHLNIPDTKFCNQITKVLICGYVHCSTFVWVLQDYHFHELVNEEATICLHLWSAINLKSWGKHQ